MYLGTFGQRGFKGSRRALAFVLPGLAAEHLPKSKGPSLQETRHRAQA